MEQEMTIQELIAFINGQRGEFIIQVKHKEEPADGKEKSD